MRRPGKPGKARLKSGASSVATALRRETPHLSMVEQAGRRTGHILDQPGHSVPAQPGRFYSKPTHY